MGTLAPELPASSGENFASDLAGMGSFFLDPPGAARRVHSKWFWVGPLIVFSILALVASLITLPIARHVMEIAPLPPNTTPEQYQRGMSIGLTIMQVSMYLAPIWAAILFAIQAAILLGASAVFGVKTGFRQLFNLITGCSLIQGLSAIAGVVILKAKGDITTREELRPALGLDIFLPAGTNKVLAAFLGYFSVFELWWIVMMVLIFAAAFKVSKGKAFAVVLPLVVVSLLLRIVFAALQR
jgi:hypothetical protein